MGNSKKRVTSAERKAHKCKQPESAGEFESVDEEAIGEPHLEGVDKRHGEGDFLPSARKPRDVLREQHAHGSGDDIVHAQGSKRQGDSLRHVKAPEDGNAPEQSAAERAPEVRLRNARQATHHVHEPLAPRIALQGRPAHSQRRRPTPRSPARDEILGLEFAIAETQERCARE